MRQIVGFKVTGIAIVDDEDQMEKIRELADGVFIMGKFTPGDVLEKAQACLQKKQELQAASAQSS